MPRTIDRVRERFHHGAYVLAFHAIEELADEGFDESDLELAVSTGRIAIMEGDRCDLCQAGRLRSRQVREYYRLGKRLVVMERVPAYICDRCGERYYAADVAKRMRQLAKSASRAKKSISFPLVRFVAA